MIQILRSLYFVSSVLIAVGWARFLMGYAEQPVKKRRLDELSNKSKSLGEIATKLDKDWIL